MIPVWFSPKGGCQQAIVNALAQAQHEVRGLAYAFNSKPIGDALIAAKRRGVDVQVVLDERENAGKPHSQGNQLVAAGVPVSLDGAHQIAHNKTMVIDRGTVIMGSFNFTTEAENDHAENLVVVHDVELARKYHDNWTFHHAHSVAWGAPKSKIVMLRGRDNPAVKPLWYPSEELIAQSCHISWGALIVLAVGLHLGAWWALAVLAAFVLPKEFLVDPWIESDSLKDGAIDTLFYAVGGVVGTALAVL